RRGIEKVHRQQLDILEAREGLARRPRIACRHDHARTSGGEEPDRFPSEIGGAASHDGCLPRKVQAISDLFGGGERSKAGSDRLLKTVPVQSPVRLTGEIESRFRCRYVQKYWFL